MAKKPLGLDTQGIQKTMRFHNYLGDGAAQLGLNALTGMVGILVYFYTDKVGIAAAAAGTVMFAARFLDAFTDLAMGWVMDRTRSRWGRARPWLLWMAGPTFLAVVLMFTVPAVGSDGSKFAYALATNTFATAIVYTAVAIPFGSMLFYTTRSTEERSKMGVIRAVFGYLLGMVIVIGYIPITNALGGDQRAWVIFAVAIGAVGAIGLVVAFLANPERNADAPEEAQQRVPFLEGLGLLFRNKYWVIMLGVMSLVNIVYGLAAGSSIYYVKWILGDENLMAVLGAVGLVPVVVGFVLIAPMVKRFGATATVRIGLLIGIAASLVRVVFPYDLWALLIFGSLVTFATIPMMAIGGVLVTNTITYGEWKQGRRLVGMANAANSFGIKVGTGLGAAGVGWILALGAYDGTAAAQPDSAIASILAVSIWVPGLVLLGMYVLLHFYDLDAKYPQIVKELDERATAAEAQRTAQV
ncbi:sugar (glycoside-pentoside-Hexuronide) transporter [Tessaracoccus rhinocerotis]|uniref:Sugar (Glycoside-pentoside-Hexuronide) transporter n=1 Tax=Tessaracoccus rhinocerotis TaxID=1689449 RepID=A0A553JYY0_9ACTN|nr:glycoside-pentoside-hexuronide (GPH):cation symporter [Tessaracoccus rhinocerotis]TRY17644.1 sugar (glycoside-pentoside-Hexuronide) transporter [Tessaracoccus rhinocerotis]